jgi:hypothetical protein
MDSTHKIAILMGLYLLASGLGILISRDYYAKMTDGASKADPILINLSGATHFIVGMLVLLYHAGWHSLMQGAVTVLGGLAVLKGSILIIVPEMTLKASSGQSRGLLMSAAFFICYGILLFALGFGLFG